MKEVRPIKGDSKEGSQHRLYGKFVDDYKM